MKEEKRRGLEEGKSMLKVFFFERREGGKRLSEVDVPFGLSRISSAPRHPLNERKILQAC